MRVAIIPARGGSRRIPRKNIRLFHGKPIIAYSIAAARASGLFDAGVWVSTEDPEIAKVASYYGARPISRPLELAEIGAPDCGTQEVTRHALGVLAERGLSIESACCIYATAPMLTPQQLQAAHLILKVSGCNYVVAVGTWLQDAAQFYFGRADAFVFGVPLLSVNTRLCPIKPETECDINTEEDWARAETMYAELNPRSDV